ncbi:hypothetical protein ElyMa_005220000 [Elysia marginata]|uniref:Uncharacterized protein n=1 Tax=Elysia marginata TaxID=1093978 RepID=A0AAV4JUZ2_9GAST|nr:hypothetical protein ElyMa_005220000 [Elysia marginata]
MQDEDRFLSGLYPSTCPAWVTLSRASYGWHSSCYSGCGDTQSLKLREDLKRLKVRTTRETLSLRLVSRQVINVMLADTMHREHFYTAVLTACLRLTVNAHLKHK